MTDDAQRAQDQEARQRFFNLLGEAVLGWIETEHFDAQPTIEELVTILEGDELYPGVKYLANHLIDPGLTKLRYKIARQRVLRCLGQMTSYQLSGREHAPLCCNSTIVSIPVEPLGQTVLNLSRLLGFTYRDVSSKLYTAPDSKLPPVEVRPVVSCRVHSLGAMVWLHSETPEAHRYGSQYEALCYAARYAPEYEIGHIVLFAYPEGWVMVRRQAQNNTVFEPSQLNVDSEHFQAARHGAYVIVPGLNPD